MDIEEEVRFKINNKEQIEKILSITTSIEEKKKTIDLVMGWEGFKSLEKFGFICRIREKNNNISLQCKKRIDNNKWEESNIKINKFEEGYQFLSLLGMKPYLYINRERETRKFGNLKICIDEVELLGTYVEVELQNSENKQKDLEKFLSETNIDNKKEALYGDIFKEKIENEEGFLQKFEHELHEFLNKK